MAKVLVVDDKQVVRDSVATTLMRSGYQVLEAADGAAALELIARQRPAAVVTDLKMPDVDGIELLKRTRRVDPQIPVVLMTAYATIDTAVQAIKLGAFDYIQKPFEGDKLVVTVQRAVEHSDLARENAALKQADQAVQRTRRLIGESSAMRQVRRQIDQVAPSHGTVLVTGDSGTGKEIVAHAIHEHSPRRDHVFLCLNCAALSANLLESELFGHEKGAFTGADQMRKGRFELADGGTLLLDEISEINLPLQAKLLRVLQEGQFERVGSSLTMAVDVRIIATTNRDLSASVESGQFRQDLFYRLNVLPIHLPPLRERSSDIPALAEHFLMQQAMRDGRQPKRFDDRALELLRRYDWPGNVRELENICERAGVLAAGPVIRAQAIESWLLASTPPPNADRAAAENATLEELERQVIVKTLSRFNGHRQRTARSLGIGVRTLGLKLKKWKEADLVAQTL